MRLMRECLNKLPKESLDLIYLARDIASHDNLPVYLVGGFVRDLLLGRQNLDLDIVVESNGIKFAEDFASQIKARLIKHKRFGTATLNIGPHLKVDIAQLRREYYPHPADLPRVSAGTLKDDLYRRDFTINAMAMSINERSFGKLIDLFGGRQDLRRKNIRTLHNLSFIDDPTRILRAIRFATRFAFKIEPLTLSFLKAALKHRMLEKVQPQRLRDELILMLKEEEPHRQIRQLGRLVGFNFISPYLSISKKTFNLLDSISLQVNWFKEHLSQRRHLDVWLIYLIALLDSLNLSQTEQLCRKFVFHRGEEKRILNYKKLKPQIISQLCAKNKPSKIFACLEPLSYEVILLLKVKYKNHYLQQNIENFLKLYNGMRTYLSGDDLRRLGILPGPPYQKIFRRLLNARLDGKVKTKDEELRLVKRELNR